MKVELSHKDDKVWMRLMYAVLREAKEVTRLGGGKIRFVTFAEKGEEKNEDYGKKV